MIRKIVQINEALCNGCGACANACHEGAIVMENKKARLIKDDYCDGLGDCLPACPADAISIIEREAAAYDEAAVKKRMEGKAAGGGCPGSRARTLHDQKQTQQTAETGAANKSMLMQWPVQIKLMPLKAPYYENAQLLIAADCTAYAYARFHEDFMKNHITVIGCPKLDEGSYTEKLCAIIRDNSIQSVCIVRMEVPCCGGLVQQTAEALRQSGKRIPCRVVTVGCDGTLRADDESAAG